MSRMVYSLLPIASSAAATVDVASADDVAGTDANDLALRADVDAQVVADVARDAADSAVTA